MLGAGGFGEVSLVERLQQFETNRKHILFIITQWYVLIYN